MVALEDLQEAHHVLVAYAFEFTHVDVTGLGVGLFDDRVPFGEFLGMFHGSDERVSETSLVQTVALLDATLAAFSRRV